MASDISLAVGDGARRMTYAELAAVRRISAVSAERLVRRRRWSRQVGNDGVVRVLVPLTEARNHRQPASSDASPNKSSDVRISGLSSLTSPLISAPDIPLTIRPLESAIETLREQLAKANQWAEAEHGRANRAEQRVDELLAALAAERQRLLAILTGPRRPWWRRWVR